VDSPVTRTKGDLASCALVVEAAWSKKRKAKRMNRLPHLKRSIALWRPVALLFGDNLDRTRELSWDLAKWQLE